MKKVFEQIKKHWRINLITFFASLLLGGGIFCLIFFLRNMTIIAAVDGAAIGSVIVIFIGLLMLVNHLGAFDTFSFGFKQLGTMMFSKDPRKENSYQEYREDKILRRSNSSYNFVIVILTGSLLSISIIVLEIIYHASIY
ncbi:MAG: DUF3899 domain-containing protein [Bacilli bacterium]|nr:DUF3899 domain-containing protein [Bacilli bacterium]